MNDGKYPYSSQPYIPVAPGQLPLGYGIPPPFPMMGMGHPPGMPPPGYGMPPPYGMPVPSPYISAAPVLNASASSTTGAPDSTSESHVTIFRHIEFSISASGRSFSAYIGNISPSAHNHIIESMCNLCLPEDPNLPVPEDDDRIIPPTLAAKENTTPQGVKKWKRVLEPSGKAKSFGFCEFEFLEVLSRALRILPQFHFTDQSKPVVVKADDDTMELVGRYRAAFSKYLDKEKEMGRNAIFLDSDQVDNVAAAKIRKFLDSMFMPYSFVEAEKARSEAEQQRSPQEAPKMTIETDRRRFEEQRRVDVEYEDRLDRWESRELNHAKDRRRDAERELEKQDYTDRRRADMQKFYEKFVEYEKLEPSALEDMARDYGLKTREGKLLETLREFKFDRPLWRRHRLNALEKEQVSYESLSALDREPEPSPTKTEKDQLAAYVVSLDEGLDTEAAERLKQERTLHHSQYVPEDSATGTDEEKKAYMLSKVKHISTWLPTLEDEVFSYPIQWSVLLHPESRKLEFEKGVLGFCVKKFSEVTLHTHSAEDIAHFIGNLVMTNADCRRNVKTELLRHYAIDPDREHIFCAMLKVWRYIILQYELYLFQ